MSKVIPQNEQIAYTRWRLPPVDGETEPADPPEDSGAEPEEPGVSESQSKLPTAAEIEEIQKHAREEGFAVGYKEGLAQARAQIAVQVSTFRRLMATLSRPFADLDEQVEQELVALATAIARQVVRRELKSEPGEIVAVVREAMAALPVAKRSVQLHLHPEDAKLVRDALALSDEERPWRIVEDPALTRGGCRVTTDTSHVDATLEKRFAALVATMMGTEREHERQHP